jgi:hypothetical protein
VARGTRKDTRTATAGLRPLTRSASRLNASGAHSLRTSATNRAFGLLTQWGLRVSLTTLRKPGALEQLSERGVPAVWLESIRRWCR